MKKSLIGVIFHRLFWVVEEVKSNGHLVIRRLDHQLVISPEEADKLVY